MADIVQITTASRYIYVLRDDGTTLSRHLTVEDAIESAVNAGPGAYDIVYPSRRVVVSKVYGVLPAVDPPSVPAGLTAEEITGGYVSLSWSGDGTSYQVYRGGTPLGSPTSSTSYTDSTVVPSTAYSYQVQAFNASGGSALSAALAVTTSANSAPAWEITDQTAILGSAYSLDLRSVCLDDDNHTLTFTISSGSVPGLSIVGSSLAGAPTVAAASSLTLDAYDGYTHSQATITFTVSDPDVVAPTVPTGVSASVNGSTVTLSWTASTDATGVAHYRVYRNGVFRATDTASPYVESGVPVGSYSYTVSAVDSSANANESAQSSAAVANVVPQTPDTPINFTATAVSSTQIDLSWAPGPNGAAPDDYDIDFSATGASGPWTAITFVGTATTYSHTGRTSGTTYYYRVRAGLGAQESGYATASALAGGEYPNVRYDGFEGFAVGTLAYNAAAYWDSLAYAPSSANTKVASTPARSGTRCIESIVDRDLDPPVSNNERSEIVFDKSQPGGRFGVTLQSTPAGSAYVSATDVWIGFSIYVPTTWRAMWKQTNGAVDYTNPTDAPIVIQFHKDPEGTTGGEKNPWLTLRLRPSVNNSSGVPAWTSTIEKNVSIPALDASTTSNPNGNGNRPVVLGEWTDVVIRARYHMWDGSADIWLKDSSTAGQWVRLAYRTGGVGYASNLKEPYIKLGAYLSLWDSVAYPTRQDVNSSNVLVRRWAGRHDDIRFYYGNDGSIEHVRPR